MVADPGQPVAEAARLGAELRRLRRERGLSQRAFTRLLGLSAHSNIADYESGRRIPPRDILAQCEALLGATDGRLSTLYAQALAERAGCVPAPATTPGAPADPEPAVTPGPALTLASASAAASGLALAAGSASARVLEPAYRRPAWYLGSVALVVVLGLVVALSGPQNPLGGSASSGSDPSPAAQPSPIPGAWDGNDPKAAGCAGDAVTIDSMPVQMTAAATVGAARLPELTQIGTVRLRYSPLCAAAWGKFEPALAPITEARVKVTVESVRPADGIRTVFEYPRLEQTYGDLLRTAPGCVQATATVTFGATAVATGTTGCLRAPR